MMRRDTGYNIIPSCTYAKDIYAIYYNTISVPSRNIASVLNNESNMRILGWLKAKPYYPRELAATMNVSEPFIVRRLKAMEEHGIVEGKWENEGGHRVKRYYPKDITLQIGDEGLEVTPDHDPTISPDKKWKYIKKELINALLMFLWLPLVLCGVLFDAPILIVIPAIFLIWWATNNIAFYQEYKPKSLNILIPAALVLAICLLYRAFLVYTLGSSFKFPMTRIDIIIMLFLIIFATLFINNFIMIFQYNSYQIQVKNLAKSKREFISSISPAPLHTKMFYLPIITTWKLKEYFDLV